MNDKLLKKKFYKKCDSKIARIKRIILFPLFKFLIHTPIKPTQLSFLYFLLMIVSAILMATGRYIYLLIGIVIFHFADAIDYLDGGIARAKGLCTQYGAWIDILMANIWLVLFIFATSIGFYMQSTNKTFALIMGGLILLPVSLFKLSGSEFHRIIKTERDNFSISIAGAYFKTLNNINIFFRRTYNHHTLHLILTLACISNRLIIFLGYLLIFWPLLIAQHLIQRRALNAT